MHVEPLTIFNVDEIEARTRAAWEEIHAQGAATNLVGQCQCALVLSAVNTLRERYTKEKNSRPFAGEIVVEAVKAGLLTPRQGLRMLEPDRDCVPRLIRVFHLIDNDFEFQAELLDKILQEIGYSAYYSDRPKYVEMAITELYLNEANVPEVLRQKVISSLLTILRDPSQIDVSELRLLAKHTTGETREEVIQIIRAVVAASQPGGNDTPLSLEKYVAGMEALYELGDEEQKTTIQELVKRTVHGINDHFLQVKLLLLLPEERELLSKTLLDYLIDVKNVKPAITEGQFGIITPLLSQLSQEQFLKFLNDVQESNNNVQKDFLIRIAPYLDERNLALLVKIIRKQIPSVRHKYLVSMGSEVRIAALKRYISCVIRQHTDKEYDLLYLSDIIPGALPHMEPAQIENIAEYMSGRIYPNEDYWGTHCRIWLPLALNIGSANKQQELLREALHTAFWPTAEDFLFIVKDVIKYADSLTLALAHYYILRVSDHNFTRTQLLNEIAPKLSKAQLAVTLEILNAYDDEHQLAGMIEQIRQFFPQDKRNKLTLNILRISSAINPPDHPRPDMYRPFREIEKLYGKTHEGFVKSHFSEHLHKPLIHYFSPVDQEKSNVSPNTNASDQDDFSKEKLLRKLEVSAANTHTLPLSYPDHMKQDVRDEMNDFLLEHINTNVKDNGKSQYILKLAPVLSEQNLCKAITIINELDMSAHADNSPAVRHKDIALSLLKIADAQPGKRLSSSLKLMKKYPDELGEYLTSLARLNSYEDLIRIAKDSPQHMPHLIPLLSDISGKEREILAAAFMNLIMVMPSNERPYYYIAEFIVPILKDDYKEFFLQIAQEAPTFEYENMILRSLRLPLSEDFFDEAISNIKLNDNLWYQVSKILDLMKGRAVDNKAAVLAKLIEKISYVKRGDAFATIGYLVPHIYELEGEQGLGEIMSTVFDLVKIPELNPIVS